MFLEKILFSLKNRKTTKEKLDVLYDVLSLVRETLENNDKYVFNQYSIYKKNVKKEAYFVF
jgi:hypothetical protein